MSPMSSDCRRSPVCAFQRMPLPPSSQDAQIEPSLALHELPQTYAERQHKHERKRARQRAEIAHRAVENAAGVALSHKRKRAVLAPQHVHEQTWPKRLPVAPYKAGLRAQIQKREQRCGPKGRAQQEIGRSARQRERSPGEIGQTYPFVGPETTLLDMFDANVCGRDFARGKPDPEIFLTAAQALGVPPAECVVIEDAQSGVQAAKAGAMACVGVARLDDQALLKAAGADWVVASLDELPVATLLSDDKMTG